RILILTTFGTSDGIHHALKAGAMGAILKNAEIDELTTAIRTVASGRRYLSPELKRIMAKDPPVEELTPRQKEILAAIVRGLTSVDISKTLGISSNMVREHTSILFRKLGAANRAEAVAIALRKHLLKI
ncbi:MAG: response regulator transcription factor, partial [bacterium]|nr:response regulator transcription factor [Candidatus Colisoma equi]